MVADLTGLPIAKASLLDEATAAAEAMHMLHAVAPVTADVDRGGIFLVDEGCHPQTIEVVKTRARPLGIEVREGNPANADFAASKAFGILLQYPATDGAVPDFRSLIAKAHQAGTLVAMATDLLALTVLAPPGELGADVAVGSAQRFGVPLGYGGPHAAFFATRAEWTRKLPGRLIGVSEDAHGNRRAADGAADPRATHPPGEGDQQHLHGAGAAGGDVRDVRRLSRPEGAARDRRARGRPRRRAGAWAVTSRGARPPREFLRQPCGSTAAPQRSPAG